MLKGQNLLKKDHSCLKKYQIFCPKLINNSKKIIFFGSGNSFIAQNIKTDELHIKEVNDYFFEEYKKDNYKLIKNDEDFNNNVYSYDHIILADIEHQKSITSNLLEISQKINDDCRIIVISKSLIWSTIIDWYKKFRKKYWSPRKKLFAFFKSEKNIY